MQKTVNITMNIDFNALREQKAVLLSAQNILGPIIAEQIDGILGLIDEIQDQSVGQHGLTEKDIFGKNFSI